MDTVGFEMYMKLLEQTVRELKGEALDDDVRATVNLKVDLRIDESYVPDVNQRLMLYRKVAAARKLEEIDRVLEEAADRYGPLPESVLNLADYGRIRVMADELAVDTIDREGRTVVLKFRPQARIDPVRLVALVRKRPELTLVPPAGLKLSKLGPYVKDGEPSKFGPHAKAEGGSSKRPENVGAELAPLTPVGLRQGPPRKGGRSQPAPSWWTARARAGEVTPGFTKAEILRPAKDNPRAPGGVFEQVGGLLSELLDRG